MDHKTDGIKRREDAERLSDIILSALPDDKNIFNPFRGRIIKRSDGNIVIMGNTVSFSDARNYLADYIWRNRKKVNRQYKKWKIAGSRVVDCGC